MQVLNSQNKTHISNRDLFVLIDKYFPEEESVGIECKFIVARSEAEKKQLRAFVEKRCEFDFKAPLLSKTVFQAKM